MSARPYRDNRINVGPVLLWWGDRSWSFHVGAFRVLWVKDSRRWHPLWSDRYRKGRVRWFGPWIVRWCEDAAENRGGRAAGTLVLGFIVGLVAAIVVAVAALAIVDLTRH